MHKDLFIETFVAAFLANYCFERYKTGQSTSYSVHIMAAHEEANKAWKAKLEYDSTE